MRGILRFDELIEYRDRCNCQPQDGCYSLPLAAMDAEPNHYCSTVDPYNPLRSPYRLTPPPRLQTHI